MKGKSTCYIHGGKSPGAPRGNRNAYVHGGRSAETVAARREANEICRAARVTIASLTKAAKDTADARMASTAALAPFLSAISTRPGAAQATPGSREEEPQSARPGRGARPAPSNDRETGSE